MCIERGNNRYSIDIESGTKRITKITIMPSDTRKGIYTDKEYGQDNMLISIASAALVSAVASVTTNGAAASMTTAMGLPEYGALAVLALVMLLCAKLMLSASTRWNNIIKCSLDMSIIPLLISFAAIVIYKIITII